MKPSFTLPADEDDPYKVAESLMKESQDIEPITSVKVIEEEDPVLTKTAQFTKQ